ncbi:MAG TPA: PAS domain-containing sensor histidine kinase [Chloroflexota bacterium]|nr:PAS domain-containing sensor histidine kinase [Chloroflexota bacterium]
MPLGIGGSVTGGGKSTARWVMLGKIAVIGVSLAIAAVIESLVQPPRQLVATPFAIPILVSTYYFSRRWIVLTASIAVAVAGLSAYLNRAPLMHAGLHLLTLLIIAGLGVLLEHQRHEIARRVQEAQQAVQTVRALIEAMPAGVVVSNERGEITFANGEAHALLGESVRGVTASPSSGHEGHDDSDLLVPRPIEFPLAQALASGQTTHGVEIQLAQPGQPEQTILAAGRPIRDDSGQITGAVATFQEITARKQAEEERERLLGQVEIERARLQAIFEHTASGVIYIDAETFDMVCNPAALRLFGLPTSPSVHAYRSLGTLLAVDGRPVSDEDMPSKRALRGETILDAEYLFRRLDGTQVPVRESAAPVRGATGAIIGAELTYQDITAFRELERLREEWMSVVAHDLRQPVTLILGFASLLSKQLGTHSELMIENRATDQVLAAVRNLNKMVGDLLDFSRIEARRLRLERKSTELVRLISTLSERLAGLATDHPVRLEVQTEEALRSFVDPTRIEQILGNLVSNAAKYGDPTSEIVVQVQRSGDLAEVAVTNYGPGIQPEDLPRLFSRFFRTREAETGHAGLGLGLYITRGLVEAHGGRIRVESARGQTTTFRFSLPLLAEDDRQGESSVVSR